MVNGIGRTLPNTNHDTTSVTYYHRDVSLYRSSKFKKADAYTKLVNFHTSQSGGNLLANSRISIRAGDMVVINNNEGIQNFYKSSYQPPEVSKFVVQDRKVPDGWYTCFPLTYLRSSHSCLAPFTPSAGLRLVTTQSVALTATWSKDSNLSDQYKSSKQSGTVRSINARILRIGLDDRFRNFCHVFGSESPFPVDLDLAKNQTVGDLK